MTLRPLPLLAALLACAPLASRAEQGPPEVVVARWNPADGVQYNETFTIPDAVKGLVLGGPGRIVEDSDAPGRKALEFDGKNPTRAQTEANFRMPGPIAVSLRVKPSAGNSGENGCTVLCLYGHLEVRYRPDRKGFSLYVWADNNRHVQLFLPAPESQWSTIRVTVVNERVTLTVNDQTTETNQSMRPVNTRVTVGSWPGRPFLGRIGDIIISEPAR